MPDPVTDRLLVTQAGDLLSPSSGAGAPRLSDILEIISGCSRPWRTWMCFTLVGSLVKSSLVSRVIYLGGCSPWNWVLICPTVPVPWRCLAWVSEWETPSTCVVIQGHRCFGFVTFPRCLERCGCCLKWSRIQLLAHSGNSESWVYSNPEWHTSLKEPCTGFVETVLIQIKSWKIYAVFVGGSGVPHPPTLVTDTLGGTSDSCPMGIVMAFTSVVFFWPVPTWEPHHLLFGEVMGLYPKFQFLTSSLSRSEISSPCDHMARQMRQRGERPG